VRDRGRAWAVTGLKREGRGDSVPAWSNRLPPPHAAAASEPAALRDSLELGRPCAESFVTRCHPTAQRSPFEFISIPFAGEGWMHKLYYITITLHYKTGPRAV